MPKIIPEKEIRYSFARSSGAGGQNVNKTSTKVVTHWSVKKSTTYTEEEKNRIRHKLSNKLNSGDEIVITCEEQRSQAQNKKQSTERLRFLVANSLRVVKKRKATHPTLSSKIKRLKGKKIRSETKKARRNVSTD